MAHFYDIKGGMIDVEGPQPPAGHLPSVTTILSVIHHPHLERWFIKKSIERYQQTQDLDDALNYRDTTGSDFGVKGHAILEAFLKNRPTPEGMDRQTIAQVEPALKFLRANLIQAIESELSFGSRELGYGGTLDALLVLKCKGLTLCDFKFKKHSQKYPMRAEPEYWYQLSAYRRYLWRTREIFPTMANLLVASPNGYDPTPCLKIVDHPTDGFEGFAACQRIWNDFYNQKQEGEQHVG